MMLKKQNNKSWTIKMYYHICKSGMSKACNKKKNTSNTFKMYLKMKCLVWWREIVALRVRGFDFELIRVTTNATEMESTAELQHVAVSGIQHKGFVGLNNCREKSCKNELFFFPPTLLH